LDGGVGAFFDEMIKQVYTPGYLLKHPEFYKFKEQTVAMNTEEVLIQSLRLCRNFNVENRLSKIEVPTLILCGSDDCFVSLKNSQDLNHKISNSRIFKLFNTGHNIFLPGNMFKISFEIEKFIQGN